MEQPNIKYIEDVAGSDADFKANFIQILKMEFPDEFVHYKNMYAAKNHIETAAIVHKLKHKLNIVGLQDGYRMAVTYEEELKKGKDAMHTDFLPILEVAGAFISTL
ncbi:Hpt domain-containing protein [Flavobacterium sp. ASW18X]|uniref:Hpt domain-containing protein n=1 Tax=Flavobacterium sp. ASW18X TaxID=2572595 RepID=UPI0010AE4346|nr:Hpt domain-containing protein [Flavobacterium sp. ASW18X]TKD66563.1 Hpt domain-containing protein [Flavobacterium sp. ASW18X]